MAQAAEGTIGQWTESVLAKYIRESIERLLPTHIPALTVDDLIVAGSLDVPGSANFNRQLHVVGTSGSSPFTNGWGALAGAAPPAYWKDENGLVFLEGTGTAGVVGQAMFPLPPGYWPDKDRYFPAQSNNTLGIVKVTAAGLVQPLATGTASNASYSLDGIVFRTSKT